MLARILAIIGLQGFAVLTAMLHIHLGVHTDEAKYLLNIPYPHPPLLRWLMGLTDGWQHQELFWRILFASFLVHGVWLVVDMARSLPREKRITVAGLWLFSGALLLQSGTVIMAPVTAVQALFFCWMLSRPEFLKQWSVLVAALWLEMLFTAYQGILFAPLVWVALQRADVGFKKPLTVFFVPVVLLVLYTLTNPLVIAAMGFVGTMSAGTPFEEFVSRGLRLWLIGGSGVLSVLGIFGIFRSRNAALLSTFILVTAYSLISYREYYAILFTPLFIAGVITEVKPLRSPAFILAAHIVMGIGLFLYVPFPILSDARQVGEALENAGITSGSVLIKGSFGHEWQYFMPGSVVRYNEELLDGSTAVVCLSPCGTFSKDWKQLSMVEEEVWVRKGQ